MHYLYLSLAVLAEVMAVCLLKASHGLSKPVANFGMAVSYMAAFCFLALALRRIPMGIAFAAWSGASLVLVVLAGWAIYGQALDRAAWLGIGLILAGLVVLHLFSDSLA